jgi:hypothetical protein
MRVSIDVGLLVLVGLALLPACGDSVLRAGGTGGGTTVASTGGTFAVGGGGVAGATSKPETGGTGGTTSAGGTGGTTSAGGTGGTTSAGGTGGTTSAGGTGGTTPQPVAGAPCPVEGQQSDCATGLPPMSACGPCMGHWLLCQGGKWIEIHCDPQPPDPRPDAAVDARDSGDARDVPQLPDGNSSDTASIDTADTGGAIDGTGILRGYLVFANELMAFEACGTTTLAWANLQGWEAGKELLPELGPYCVTTDAGPAPCPGTIYVELAGTIVSGGSYGHMGKFSSQLTVGRYLAASLIGPADCPFLPPVYPK